MAVTNNQMLSGAYLLIDTSVTGTYVAAKASSATLYELELDNSANAAASYFKIYNTGAPTVGSTVPDWVVMVPASTSRTLVVPSGLVFGTALSYACTTAGGTSGSTSPSSAFALKMVYV
jgi:hypothetical protein